MSMSVASVGWGGIKDFVLGGLCPLVDAKDLTGAANRVAPGISSILCVKRSEKVWTGVSGSHVRGRSQVLIWKTVVPVKVRITPVASKSWRKPA